MSLDPQELKELAFGSLQKSRAIPTNLWKRLAAVGLHGWAAELQGRLITGGSNLVPSLEALQQPAPAELHLVPPIAPAPKTAPKVTSRRSLNRGLRTQEAVAARREQEQSLAFAPRDFVAFSLPHKRQEANIFERINGKYRFRIETGGGLSVPFGQDRLFLLWLATAFQAAGQPADNRIRFRSANDILAAFRIAKDGGSSKALAARIERWFHTTLYVYDEADPDRHRARSYRLLEEVDVWYQRPGGGNQYTLWQNVIQLDSRFAEGLRTAAIPIDFETVVALRDMPGALDLYVWQAHRSWELAMQGSNRPVVVPLEYLRNQLGSSSPPRKAKQLFKQWQGIVKEVWPQCPNYFDPTRNAFFLNAGKAVFERATTRLPGVVPEPPVPLLSRPVLPDVPVGGLVLRRPPLA